MGWVLTHPVRLHGPESWLSRSDPQQSPCPASLRAALTDKSDLVEGKGEKGRER